MLERVDSLSMRGGKWRRKINVSLLIKVNDNIETRKANMLRIDSR